MVYAVGHEKAAQIGLFSNRTGNRHQGDRPGSNASQGRHHPNKGTGLGFKVETFAVTKKTLTLRVIDQFSFAA
jgi:hypothetical protein